MSREGSKFGPYELERRLGVGGMAETFVAVRRGPGGFEQHVCLKRILPAFEADEDFVRQFLHEARLSATLRHTNVAQVIDFGVHDGSHYLALELIDGLDLRGLLKALRRREQTVPAGLVAFVATELAAALDHAAAHDIVHRDISPSNVLLSTAGEVKLTDFGIARAMGQPGVTRTGVIKGKVPYMSPEYANHGRFDARSDMFALGVVVFECLAGKRPYDGMSDLETVARSTHGAHEPLAELAPGTPAALVAAVERLIEPEPGARFESPSALLDALAESPPPPNARRELGRLVRDALEPAPSATPHRRVVDAKAPDAAGVRDVEVLPTIAIADTEPAASDGPTQVIGESATTEALTAEAPATGTQLLTGVEPLPPAPHPGRMRTSGPEEPTRTKTAPGAGPAPAPGPSLEAETPPGARKRERRMRTIALGGTLVVGFAALAIFALGQARSPHASETVAAPPVAVRPAARRTEREGAEASAKPAEGAPVGASADPAEGADPGAADQSGAPTSAAPAQKADPVAVHEAGPDAADQSGTPTSERATRPSHAYLSVFVVPFGDVWIDGRHVGPSPVHVRVRPGSHTVATGEKAPEKSTTVRVVAGQRRRIVLR